MVAVRVATKTNPWSGAVHLHGVPGVSTDRSYWSACGMYGEDGVPHRERPLSAVTCKRCQVSQAYAIFLAEEEERLA